MSRNLIVLAIESSCDDTAIAVMEKSDAGSKILSSVVSSQIMLHAAWGGVVPNLAAREHLKNISHVFQAALAEAKINIGHVDVIAVTSGPGLMPSLLVGNAFAKTLAYKYSKPLIGIHHIEGHIYANFVGGISNDEFRISKQNEKKSSLIQNSKLKIQNSPNIQFPILCLVVSGGHTQLVFMNNHFQYEIIGQTLDDAAGEAFDKVARILNIGYPGGPAIARCAMNFQFPISNFQSTSNDQISNDKTKSYEIRNAKYEIRFPRPMLNKKNFDFSFSGLKTAVLYETKKNPGLLKNKGYIAEVCHEFQQAVIDVLIAKTIRAAQKYQPKTIMLAGGVSANTELREQLSQTIKQNLSNVSYCVPDMALTGDNAAMIGAAAVFRWEQSSQSQKIRALQNWQSIKTDANLKLK